MDRDTTLRLLFLLTSMSVLTVCAIAWSALGLRRRSAMAEGRIGELTTELALEQQAHAAWVAGSGREKQALELMMQLSQASLWEFTLRDESVLNSYVSDTDRVQVAGFDSTGWMDFRTALARTAPPEDHASLVAAIQDCVDGKTTAFHAEYRTQPHDGMRWRMARGIVTRASDGTPQGFLATSVDITHLKLTHEALRESEERFRATFENAAVGMAVTDRDGVILEYNDLFSEFLGYSRQELLGQPFTALLLPDEVERNADHQRRIVNGEEPRFSRDQRCLRKDGSLVWGTVSTSVVQHDADGNATRVMQILQDISRRRSLEADLHRTKDLLELGIRGSSISIFDFDMPDGRIETSRQTMINVWETLGYDPAEAPGDFASGAVLAVHPDDLAHVRATIGAYMSGASPTFEVEFRVRHRSGAIFWHLARGTAIRNPAGMALRFMGSFVDITDRKHVEQRLRESEAALRQAKERLEVAIRSSNLSTWEYDMPDGSLENSRETLTNVWESLGYDVAVATPVSTYAVIHAEDLGRVGEQVRAYLSGESPTFETEHRVRHQDGSYRWILGRGLALRDSDGRPVRFVGTSVDITDIKRIEHELSLAREEAESANRAKDEFLANVSHEIRTPMNAILGMTELALDSARTEQQRQLLSTVRSAARNLLNIINDLLDFSKIAAGKLALDPVDFSLRAALGDTLRALATRAHRKGLELICHVRPDVPDALFGDAGRLRQVLTNLVGNALKFTAKGEVEIQVALASDGSPMDTVLLRFDIRDTGIGIARDKQTAIFRAFEQEDSSTTRKYGGTGLGLTISAQLAALMGGEITVDSEPGRGSTFGFTARFPTSVKPALAGSTLSPERLLDLRVLVVDDNETNRRILEEWLTSWRMLPVGAADASSALAALVQAEAIGAPYSLVLLDGRMPDADGIGLAHQIRERFAGASKRLILLSSDDSPAFAARSRDARIDAYLLKPVQHSQLLETIWAVMNSQADAGKKLPLDTGGRGDTPVPTARPSLHILVAEDNDLNVALLQELLTRAGHRAQFANDGRAALALATQVPFDLLFLDLHMPELDGFQVVRAIREREKATGEHLPIVALTARSSRRDRELCLAAGMDDFLPKPIEAAALWAAIDRMVATFHPPAVRTRLLDPGAILRACGGSASILEKLGAVFRKSLPGHMTRVGAALRDEDLPRLAEAAHLLYGTLGAFSTVAGAVALTLEDAARRHDPDSCRELVDRLESMCTELLEDTRSLTLEGLQR